jgi:hypothetical protein
MPTPTYIFKDRKTGCQVNTAAYHAAIDEYPSPKFALGITRMPSLLNRLA